jgi:phenylpyruvate tautomerase PptA (4-oxalocrotonate tautomerase family)
MALARIVLVHGIVSAELRTKLMKEVARVLRTALGVEKDDTGVFTMAVEIDDGQWAVGSTIPTLSQWVDKLGTSERRRAEVLQTR